MLREVALLADLSMRAEPVDKLRTALSKRRLVPFDRLRAHSQLTDHARRYGSQSGR